LFPVPELQWRDAHDVESACGEKSHASLADSFRSSAVLHAVRSRQRQTVAPHNIPLALDALSIRYL